VSFRDVDFLLDLQRRAVEAGQAFLAGNLCALLTERMEEERREGRLDAHRLAHVRRLFDHNLSLLSRRRRDVLRRLRAAQGDHEAIKTHWSA